VTSAPSGDGRPAAPDASLPPRPLPVEEPWTAERAVETYRALFRDAPFTIASNREPWVQRRAEGGGVELVRPAGGLTAALDPVMAAMGGTWIAWGPPGTASAPDGPSLRFGVPPDAPAYEVRRVPLSEIEVRNYYHGYANESLWPLCRSILEHVRFRERFWRAYVEVNRRFADAVLEEAGDPRTLVWIQDYHLALVPELVRARRPEARIAHFWHIPWPSWDLFRVCPNHRELLRGLLANDLLGFHLESFCDNFLRCCEQDLEVLIDWRRRAVVHEGHVTLLRALPISIDAESFHELAGRPDTVERIAELRRRYRLEDRLVGVGVDRLDYSKGILERLDALRFLFRRHPELVGRFTFVQIGSPSRVEIAAYAELQQNVEAAVARLNDALATPDWTPVVYVPRGLQHEDLAAFYRMADVAIVSSLQDGMNLVAKEFVAAQVDRPGVLCLSEFAGASEELEHAITVNPFYTEGFAEDLYRALQMEAAEREERMRAMQAILKRGNVYRWISDVFGAAREALDLGRRRAQPRSRPGGSGLPAPLSTEPPRAAPEPGTAAASA
jgi:trehalose 6-phosphate synthase